MKGGIYSEQKCPICDETLKDDGRRKVCCPNHPDQVAANLRVHFGKVKRRFKSYDEAYRFLTGLRYKTDENSFDERDYSKEKPLSFMTLASKYLDVKRETVKSSSYRNLHNYMMKACDAWGNTNIKHIGYAEIEDFLIAQGRQLSSKTISNIKSCLHDFFQWLLRREVITHAPNFPSVKVKLSYRNIISKEKQTAILDEVGRIAPFKVWLGIKWLSTYISIRPGELVQIREQDIDTDNRYLYIHHSKTGETKPVPMISEDIEFLKQINPGFPRSFFFRHETGKGGVRQGQRYGEKFFYKWWKRACNNLNIQGVDLYGGTRHSSAVALRNHFTPEQIKQGTMHQTNKAFERYFRIGADDVRNIYEKTATTCNYINRARQKKTS